MCDNGAKRYCYITVDSAIAALQNGFFSNRISPNNKINFITNMHKNIMFFKSFYAYHRAVYITRILSQANTVMLCSRCKIRRYVAAPSTRLCVSMAAQKPFKIASSSNKM
jgi:hypothetical protein